jgi:hypothetical protein
MVPELYVLMKILDGLFGVVVVIFRKMIYKLLLHGDDIILFR